MSTVQQYKCPCCDGAIEFDSGVQKMKCLYCDTEFDMEALRELDEPLLQTSANRSGCPNALNVDEALSMLSGTPDAVADAGAIAPDAQASTIVDCTAGHLRVIRQGMLRVDEFL